MTARALLRVRPIRRLAGAALLIGGLVLIATSYVPSSPVTYNVPVGGYVSFESPRLTATTLDVSWTGSPAVARVFLTVDPPSCATPTAPGEVGHGTGVNGSFQASVRPGITYFLFACDGIGNLVAAEFACSEAGGLSLFDLIGGGLCAGGVILLLLRRPRPRPKGSEERPLPAKELLEPPREG